MGQVATSKTTRRLPVQLSEDEVRLRGIELADVNKTHIDLQAEKKDVARSFKEKIDATNKAISVLKDAVRNGVEVREVDVEIRKNQYLGSISFVRMDTSEVVETRMMTEREMQGSFDWDEDKD